MGRGIPGIGKLSRERELPRQQAGCREARLLRAILFHCDRVQGNS